MCPHHRTGRVCRSPGSGMSDRGSARNPPSTTSGCSAGRVRCGRPGGAPGGSGPAAGSRPAGHWAAPRRRTRTPAARRNMGLMSWWCHHGRPAGQLTRCAWFGAASTDFWSAITYTTAFLVGLLWRGRGSRRPRRRTPSRYGYTPNNCMPTHSPSTATTSVTGVVISPTLLNSRKPAGMSRRTTLRHSRFASEPT